MQNCTYSYLVFFISPQIKTLVLLSKAECSLYIKVIAIAQYEHANPTFKSICML